MSEEQTENKEVRDELMVKLEALKQCINDNFDCDDNVMITYSRDLKDDVCLVSSFKGDSFEFSKHLAKLIKDSDITSKIIKGAYIISMLDWEKEDLMKLIDSIRLITLKNEV